MEELTTKQKQAQILNKALFYNDISDLLMQLDNTFLEEIDLLYKSNNCDNDFYKKTKNLLLKISANRKKIDHQIRLKLLLFLNENHPELLSIECSDEKIKNTYSEDNFNSKNILQQLLFIQLK